MAHSFHWERQRCRVVCFDPVGWFRDCCFLGFIRVTSLGFCFSNRKAAATVARLFDVISYFRRVRLKHVSILYFIKKRSKHVSIFLIGPFSLNPVFLHPWCSMSQLHGMVESNYMSRPAFQVRPSSWCFMFSNSH